MCPSSQSSLNTVRKIQFVVALAAWPCALAAIFKTHSAPESILQIIFISLSGLAALDRLCARSNRAKIAHLPIEIIIDAALGSSLIAIYIGGMVVLAKRWIGHWGYAENLVHGIPQIYSNLACLILGILHVHDIIKVVVYRYVLPKIKSRINATYMCPSCARDANVIGTPNWRDSQDNQPTTFTEDRQGLYTDNDVESRPLLQEESRGNGSKQETGIVNMNEHSTQ